MKEYERIIMNDSERSEQYKLMYIKIKMLATVSKYSDPKIHYTHRHTHISISKLAVMMTATLTAAEAAAAAHTQIIDGHMKT